MKKCIALAALIMAFLSTSVFAQVAPEISDRILNKLKQARGELPYSEVKPSPIKGMYQVDIDGGPSLFVSEDGGFFVAGDLFAVQEQGFVNLVEVQRSGQRKEAIAAVSPEDMIIFSPKAETKAVLHVFTDVDCGYCQKLHQEIATYNDLGIEIRYLAYPRAGPDSATAQKLATAWCAKDKQTALTRLKNREQLPMNVCAGNPITEQYELGVSLGVSGTPNMVAPDGSLIPGYRPAEEMAVVLGIAADSQ